VQLVALIPNKSERSCGYLVVAINLKMNRQFPSIILSLLTLTSCSQDYSVRKLVESNPHSPADEYTFPILEGPDKKVTRKINSYLVNDQLSIELGQEKESIFENVWQKPEDPVARINHLTFKENLLNEKLYTVTISGEFCIAYCEGYDMSYTFDLEKGDLLTLDTLFSENGQEKLLSELTKYKRTLIERKIEEVKQIAQSDKLDSGDEEYYRNMLDLYQNCNSEYADLKHFRYIPSQDSLQIIYGRCSAHYNRNVDELWYFNKTISIDEWSNELSEVGREKIKN
jgi:hypothetical protein